MTRELVTNLIVGNSLLTAAGFLMCGEFDLKNCEAFVKMMEDHGVPFGTLIIDDFWGASSSPLASSPSAGLSFYSSTAGRSSSASD